MEDNRDVSEHFGDAAIPRPTTGIDRRTALATALHAAPGVYAVLVGSGMSSAAGIPTGWQVVQDLIRKIATAEDINVDEVGDAPDEWWIRSGRPEPRYDAILSSLAITDAARQALLRSYFDPPPESGGPCSPTSGHNALAWLCATGRVKVILTTNFDRLLERALDAQGISAQVVSSPEAIAGMIPLAHSECTVIKLHGDYLTSGLRNSPEELQTYPESLNRLLDDVFDQYGLLVVGWSAEYDVALGAALQRAPSRRYPVFWTAREGRLTESARRLVASREATTIEIKDADEFFSDLVQRVERLDRIAVRRQRPTLNRTYAYMPNSSAAPSGWAVLPLLQLRSVAAVGPASQQTCGLLRAENRDRLIDVVRGAALAQAVRNLSGYRAAWAVAEADEMKPTPQVVADWEPTPGAHQSTDVCSYRLGGDARAGASLLLEVRFPGFGVEGQVVITADTALSLENKLRLGEAAKVLRDGLLLVTATVPEAFADILPGESDVTVCEVHFLAPMMYGNATQGNRVNDVSHRVDLSPLGTPSNAIGQQMGCGFRIAGALTEREASEIVCEGLDYMAHAVGFLDPRLGLQVIRQELGVS